MPPASSVVSSEVCQVLLLQAGVRHVAIIMDGNRRWAKQRHLPTALGHAEGVQALKRLVRFSAQAGLSVLTVYAFSTENWRRSQEEVGALMDLFVQALGQELESLHQENVCLRFIGDWAPFSESMSRLLHQATDLTAQNTGLRLQVALNYGARAEITAACQALARQVQAGQLCPEDITEARLSEAMSSGAISPDGFSGDPELLIRTGGEYRLSNFLLWQCAYAELYVTDTLWPDFSAGDFCQALETFTLRQRRFGR